LIIKITICANTDGAINRHVAYIDNKLEEYSRVLAEHDGDNKELISDEIAKQEKRKDQYKEFEKELKESGEPQISISDPESRQAIVEHPFGIIKRQWGFSYILTKKGIKRASADVRFMFIACNLRRIGNILTRDQLIEYLRILVSLFLSKIHLSRLKKQTFQDNFFPEISLG